MWNLKTRLSEKSDHPTLMPPYQETIVKRLIDSDYFITTGEMHKLVEDELGFGAISRASVIFFMKDLHENGYAEHTKGTGKGGVHSKYNITMTSEQFQSKLTTDLTMTLAEILDEIFIKGE